MGQLHLRSPSNPVSLAAVGRYTSESKHRWDLSQTKGQRCWTQRVWPCLPSRMLLAHQGATGTAGVGQGDTSAQVSDKTPWTVLSDSVPVPIPSLEAEAHLQSQGGSQKSPKSAKGPEGLSLRTHLRRLKETPDSRLMRSGELFCLGLPTQDMMDSMVLQDSRLPLQDK